jgi:hypothetical protein
LRRTSKPFTKVISIITLSSFFFISFANCLSFGGGLFRLLSGALPPQVSIEQFATIAQQERYALKPHHQMCLVPVLPFLGLLLVVIWMMLTSRHIFEAFKLIWRHILCDTKDFVPVRHGRLLSASSVVCYS